MAVGPSDDDAVGCRPTTVPKLVKCDPTKLSLDRIEAFVLSQIDGRSSVDDLTSLVGLDFAQLGTVLARLVAIGAVELGEDASAGRGRTRVVREAISVEVFGSRASRERTSPPLHPSQPAIRKNRVAATTTPPLERPAPRTKSSAHHAATPSAPPPTRARSTRRPPAPETAHVRVRSTERPPKSEKGGLRTRSTQRLPAADKASLRTRSTQRLPAANAAPARTKPTSQRAAVALPPLPPVSRSAETVKEPLISMAPYSPQAPSSVPVPPSSDPSMSQRRPRIRIQTGRQSRTSAPIRIAEEVVVVAPIAEVKEASPPSGQEGRNHARVFIEAAEAELERGNFVAASAQFQLALNCSDSLEIRRAFEAVEELARPMRFATHKAHGENAEKDGRWGDAATAYGKAHKAKPDARVGERLANAMRLSSGDLRIAAKLAEDAVQREPAVAGFRVTLAEIYLDAKLDVRAQAEVKRALELAPDEPRAKALAAKLAKAARER